MTYKTGPTKKPPSKLLLVVIAAIFGFFLFVGIHDLLVERALDSRGVSTRGIVTERYHSSGKGSSTWLKYAYIVDGNRYAAKSNVTYTFYRAVAVGDSIPVLFLPDSPSTARCWQSTGYRQGYLLCCTGIISLLLLVVLFRSGRKRTAEATVFGSSGPGSIS